jgi:hypothetical protein
MYSILRGGIVDSWHDGALLQSPTPMKLRLCVKVLTDG